MNYKMHDYVCYTAANSGSSSFMSVCHLRAQSCIVLYICRTRRAQSVIYKCK